VAAFNVVGAQKEGYSKTEIADYLAGKTGFDVAGAREEGYTDDEIIGYLNRQGMSKLDSFIAGAKAEILSEVDGAKQLLGGELSNERILEENLARQSETENYWSTLSGRLLGGLVNPSTLLPGSAFFKGWKGMAAAGGLGGAVSGAVRPEFTEEDSRLQSAAIGAGLGTVLGGAIGGVVQRFGRGADAAATVPSASARVEPTQTVVDLPGGGTVDIPGAPVVEAGPKIEMPKVGDIKLGPDNMEYEFLGRQWVNKQNGRIATREVSAQLNPVIPVAQTLDTQGQDVVQAAVNQFDVNNLPKLPNYLRGAQPSFFTSKLEFETEVDKALYIVGNPTTKSKSHDEYVKFLKTSLNLSDSQISKLGAEVRKEVIARGKQAQLAASKGKKPIDVIPFRMSKALDSVVNPIEKHLDEQTKIVYNFGKSLTDDMVPGDKIAQAKAEGVADIYKRLDPNASDLDMLATIKDYTKLLQASKQQQGRAFRARSLEDMLVNKHKNTDTLIDAALAGELDGC